MNRFSHRRASPRRLVAVAVVTAAVWSLGIAMSLSRAGAADTGEPPNLLFIIVDEQRYDTLAAAGNDRIQMPHLNRLAAESLVFQRAYCCQPVCGPARSSILTGTWPHWNGQKENRNRMRDDVPCLPAMISQGDYATAYLGRIGHLKNGQGAVPGPGDVDVYEQEATRHRRSFPKGTLPTAVPRL